MEHTLESDLTSDLGPAVASDLTTTGFLEEARGYAPQVTACLDTLMTDVENRPALEEIFRIAHTLRGASGTAGLEEASTIAQSAEELAEAILNGDLPMDVESVELFREAFNGVFDSIERAAPADWR